MCVRTEIHWGESRGENTSEELFGEIADPLVQTQITTAMEARNLSWPINHDERQAKKKKPDNSLLESGTRMVRLINLHRRMQN